jgi:hypothetical protein
VASATLEQVRAEVSARLKERREEIEAAALARTWAVSDPAEVSDPEYTQGLRTALAAALDYGIAAVELGDRHSPPVPETLLSQARLAARSGVSLDTVLRRYFAGFTLFGDFVIREAEGKGLPKGISMHRLLAAQSAQFDRLVAAVSQAHTTEREARFRSPAQRKAEQVRQMLDGKLIDGSELDYDLHGWHLGAIATGEDAEASLQGLAQTLDRRLLRVCPEERVVWGWFGGRRRIDLDEIDRLAAKHAPPGTSLALGEPAQGLAGWRLTHRQAKAALPVALRVHGGYARYSEVALLASMLQDDLLATSLHDLYLAPLAQERDGGEVLRDTLRAYLAAEGNASSAAAALGVNRQTITNRLRVIEQRLGRPLSAYGAEIDAALRLEDLGHPITSRRG